MKKQGLRHGYTTGACAAAAARGAALMLRDQRVLEEVEIVLPRGERARFRLHGQSFSRESASCFVIKDAGDDPDVTNGAEIHITVSLHPPRPPFDQGGSVVGNLSKQGNNSPSPQPSPTRGEGALPHGRPGLMDSDDQNSFPSFLNDKGNSIFVTPPLMGGGKGEGDIVIQGGTGIGRVTKPGLAVPVGEWAVNPVPRKMIAEAVREVFSQHSALSTQHDSPHVLISIPNGEELARKTLNARLGIIGGLSILGTTGIVRPISAKAWTDTIDTAIDVALACGCRTLVFSTGRTSERAAQHFFSRSDWGAGHRVPDAQDPLPAVRRPLSDECYIMMGDHVGHALRAASQRGVEEVVLAGQFAKLLKIACGHEQTHADSSRLDLRALVGWLDRSPHASRLTPHAVQAHTARELFESTSRDQALIDLVCSRASRCAGRIAPDLRVKVFLAGYDGEVVYFG